LAEINGFGNTGLRKNKTVPKRRNSTGDYIRFLQIACGSLYELQTQLEISLRLEYLSAEDYDKLTSLSIEIEKMTSSLISKVKSSHK
jgi:four helix bundle protein